MSQEIASPLQSIIKKLASQDIQGPAAKLKKRFVGASEVIAVLADCSGSMADFVGSFHMSKWDHLQVALKDVVTSYPAIRIVAFDSVSKVVANPSELPYPSGSTDLAGALKLAAQWKPQKTIVISDGLPDNERAALKIADSMTGAIDTIYCGPDGDPAVEFLQRLSKESGGSSAVWTGQTEIGCTIRGFLR